MARSRVSHREALERLIPVEYLDAEGQALYREAVSAGDADVASCVVALFEHLARLGWMRETARTTRDGVERVTYRNLTTLDTVTVPRPSRSTAPPSAAAPPETPAASPAAPPAGILQVVAASSRRTDLAGALVHLYEYLEGPIGVDHVALYLARDLLNSNSAALGELEDVAAQPPEEQFHPDYVRRNVEAPARVLRIPDLSAEPRFAPHARVRPGHRSLIVAPLKADAYVYGVLEAWGREPEAFDDEAAAAVEFVASFAGGLIKRRLEVEELIFIDELTGIHNRRYFDEQLSREIERARRNGNAMALFMIDLDSFKAVNDTHGHPCGDSVLRQVAGLLAGSARQVDIVARYGGEEFAIILPRVTRDTARQVAERVRESVANHPFNTGVPEAPVLSQTISVGGALYPLDADSRIELLDKADRVALYEAKRRGKNEVVFWQDLQNG